MLVRRLFIVSTPCWSKTGKILLGPAALNVSMDHLIPFHQQFVNFHLSYEGKFDDSSCVSWSSTWGVDPGKWVSIRCTRTPFLSVIYSPEERLRAQTYPGAPSIGLCLDEPLVTLSVFSHMCRSLSAFLFCGFLIFTPKGIITLSILMAMVERFTFDFIRSRLLFLPGVFRLPKSLIHGG